MNDSLTMILAMPILAIIAVLTPLFGFFTNMYGQLTNLKGWFLIIMFAIGIITGLGLTFAGLIGSLQLIQVIVTFMFLPLLLNSQEVLSIMGDHRLLISGMFGLLVVMGAFKHLKPLTGIVMSITYLLLVIKNYLDNKK